MNVQLSYTRVLTVVSPLHSFIDTHTYIINCCAGWFAVAYLIAVVIAGICYVFKVPEKARLLFTEDTVGYFTSTN